MSISVLLNQKNSSSRIRKALKHWRRPWIYLQQSKYWRPYRLEAIVFKHTVLGVGKLSTFIPKQQFLKPKQIQNISFQGNEFKSIVKKKFNWSKGSRKVVDRFFISYSKKLSTKSTHPKIMKDAESQGEKFWQGLFTRVEWGSWISWRRWNNVGVNMHEFSNYKWLCRFRCQTSWSFWQASELSVSTRATIHLADHVGEHLPKPSCWQPALWAAR